MKTGLIVGKFYPPHLGHKFLIDEAAKQVDQLTIAVGSKPTETISVEQRVSWLRTMCPKNAIIISVPDDNPPDLTPHDDAYWTIWRDNLLSHIGTKPDIVFGSDKYIQQLAGTMGAKAVIVDLKRENVPISATMIRNDPKKYQDYLPEVVRSYFQKEKRIFVVSDTHFNHKNIIKYENRPEDFNEVIIANWNKIVGPNDVVIHLGDVIFGMERSAALVNIMNRLNGKKVLARGNHDENDWDWYMERGFDFVCDYYVYKNIAFSHAPLTPLPKQTLLNNGMDVQVNIHGHFHRGNHRAPKDDDPNFHDNFYDYNFWRTHKDKYKLVQIEDELRPFSLEEILAR